MMMSVSRPNLQLSDIGCDGGSYYAGRLLMIVSWTLQILLQNMANADDDEALQDEDVSYYMSNFLLVVILVLLR